MSKTDDSADDSSVGPQRRAGVQSIDRAVAILRCFDGRSPELGISELARQTGLSTTTVHRLLAAMQKNHLVRQTGTKRYGLGPFLLQLANSGAIPRTFREAALPFMTDLRDEFDETVGLHEYLGAGHRIVAAQVESHQELRRTYTDIGVPIKLPHGGPGKAIWSALPQEERRRYLAEPIEKKTEATTVDPVEVERELDQARARGYATSKGQRTVGIYAIASPVFNHTQKVIGAIGVSVPEVRMTEERAEHMGQRVREVAWQLSTTLGATEEGVHALVPDIRLG
ncbi:transcriptional regulator, IclR family protein [Mycolicibacterium agri]|uniref:Glycerol operon regulatory protein n=1 Tax=Mycolicibacterium agri TaxID=36811 RepID=A0A2A7MUM2_MYCAG|nr:IclR family transcriptional regulator [Mycolicibacterium agri]PEG35512.1 transcriptional regulator, IclR family protein [Mycolicibacterium agri]GFG48958.1 IclR family transcriptional regulator [Mycolicibacterium agri]